MLTDLSLENQQMAKLNKKPKGVAGIVQEVIKNKVLFLLMLPGFLIMIVNNYIPMAGIVLAFENFNYKDKFLSPWVGLENFKFLFSGSDALIMTRNTILYNSIFIIISMILPVVMAIVLNEIRNKRLAKVYQSVFFLPYFLSWVVVSYLIFSLLSSDMGFINSFLKNIGMQPIEWYTEVKYWPAILIATNTWKWTGYDTIIMLAAIVGIDKTYYEAAAVDGATKLQQIFKITIPMLLPTISIVTLLKVGRMFYTDFGLFYIVPKNQGILFDATQTIDTYVYRALIQTGDTGMAAASGFYQAICGFIVVFTVNWIVRRLDKDSALF
jgi:putative aldouronate transport system permease protein